MELPSVDFNHMKNINMREKIWGLSSSQRLCSGISAGTVDVCLVLWKGQAVAGSRQPLGWMQCLFAGVALCLVQPSVTKGCAAKHPLWLQMKSDLWLEEFWVLFLEKSGYGEGEKSCDGGLVLCDRCTAAPLPLRTAQEAFGTCGAAGAIPARSHSYLEGENRAQWGYLNNMGWVYKSPAWAAVLSVLSVAPFCSVSCSRALSLHGPRLLFLLHISPKVWPAASCSSPFPR